MGKSAQRDVYFEKYIRNTPTPAAYINALRNSPYRTHNRMAVALVDSLKRQEQELDKQVSVQTDNEEREEA